MSEPDALQSLWWRTPPSVVGVLARWLLAPFACVFGAIVALRHLVYKRGLVHRFRAPVPVVSVGNITVGGTGKTPTVKWLAHWLLHEGYRPVVLQRGYGSRVHGTDLDEEGALLRAAIPGIRVIQGTEVRNGRGDWSFADEPKTVVILDDGFQRFQMQRDVDIVLLDATRPYGNGWPLPAGPLREWPQALARADIVMVSRSDQAPETADGLRLSLSSGAPHQLVIAQRHVPTKLLPTGAPASVLRDQSVWLLSAIGHPSAFHETVARCGARILGGTSLADHAEIPTSLVQKVAARAKELGASLVLVTSKDLPKISHVQYSVPIQALDVDVEFSGDTTALTSMLRERLFKQARA